MLTACAASTADSIKYLIFNAQLRRYIAPRYINVSALKDPRYCHSELSISERELFYDDEFAVEIAGSIRHSSRPSNLSHYGRYVHVLASSFVFQLERSGVY